MNRQLKFFVTWMIKITEQAEEEEEESPSPSHMALKIYNLLPTPK